MYVPVGTIGHFGDESLTSPQKVCLRGNVCDGFWALAIKKLINQQVRMYYGSGTVDRIASELPAYAAAAGTEQKLSVRAPDGSTFLRVTTSWPPT